MDSSIRAEWSVQGKEQEFLIAQIQTQIERMVEDALRPSVSRLAAHYFQGAPQDALRLQSSERLARVALDHFRLARRRVPGEILLRVHASTDPDVPSSIASCFDDMAYLFDTAMLAVRAQGVNIEFAVHPVLRVQRDADGELYELQPAAADQDDTAASGRVESWIHIDVPAAIDPGLLETIAERIRSTFADLQLALADGAPMRKQALELAARLRSREADARAAEASEAAEFLEWLCDGHFLFLGYLETAVSESAGVRSLLTQQDSALGLARSGRRFSDQERFFAPQAELNKYADSLRLVVVTKANEHSPIHVDDLVDIISVKLPGADGALTGSARFLGLFTSDVYVDRPRTIPLIRRKAEYVVRRAQFPEGSHSAKRVREILHLLPRDELFQSSEEELFNTCMGIRALRDRQALKLFMRRDRYGRFYSFMVYMPRERYSRELRDKVQVELLRLMNGVSADRQMDFLRDGVARIRYIIHTAPGTVTPLSVDEIEQKLINATRSWRDQLRNVLLHTEGAQAQRFADAFPLSYSEMATPIEAATDVLYLQQLSASHALIPRLLVDEVDAADGCAAGLRLYAWQQPVALSDVLPTLENFGLRVIRQDPTEIVDRNGEVMWIQHFEIRNSSRCRLNAAAQRSYFETAFSRCWSGESENDPLNALVLGAGLDWRQVVCLRAITRYINQMGLPYGRETIERQLASQPDIARRMVALFEARFDPAISADHRQSRAQQLNQELAAALDALLSLDADRVLRCYLAVINATLRTNYYQRQPDGEPKPWLSFKVDPARIPELPLPRPMFEIWVCSPQVEGVHLRGGRVARGGLRWSDRHEDFRTEVLGLMKAQMVKNAVIVPVGAKGGFVVKQPLPSSDREAWLKQGIACYQTFLRGLLDITDNRVGNTVVPPPDVVRHDGDDPYLVVAADKGTATFSDIANALALEYGFWLGDAFASGGSAGYDHKKMGITARGAWESVKHHFRALGVDPQQQAIRVVGIGDMSGDVFGNGMLLSPQIHLIAAFDHRHIFVDPQPDPGLGLAERQRLFALPRSSWADYRAELISAGGGVWPRSAKSIALSPQMQAALGTDKSSLTPAQLISTLLRAPVDLLWNGGIGTYVKASHEAHEQVGDRANDAIRISARELRCKVVGEGGNLGFTQAGRIEYALAGGRINTDAIDNAGGVHSSDREVNIKIPLNQLMAEGVLDRSSRDPLLVSMTDAVARAVLRDNYVQPSCISLDEGSPELRLDEHLQLIRALERDGLLSRALESIPDDETLAERRSRGFGLTRPELAVLLAYAKISLFDALEPSSVVDEAFFERDLLAYFPPQLVERYPEALKQHRLRREIIATILSNAVVNRMGVAFAHTLAEDHGVSREAVIKAYAAVHYIMDGDAYWQAVEALDYQLPAELQLRLMRMPINLLKHGTRWLVYGRKTQDYSTGELVERYSGAVRALEAALPDVLPPPYLEEWKRAVATLVMQKVPEILAQRLTNTQILGSALDLADVAGAHPWPVEEIARLYFIVGEYFDLLWLHRAIRDLPVQGKWPTLARNNLRDDTYAIHRVLTERVLLHAGDSAAEKFQRWLEANAGPIGFTTRRLHDIKADASPNFYSLVVYVRELRKLRRR